MIRDLRSALCWWSPGNRANGLRSFFPHSPFVSEAIDEDRSQAKSIGMTWPAMGNHAGCCRFTIFVLFLIGGATGAPVALSADSFPVKLRGLLDSYCFDCHSGKQAEGGFDLNQLAPPSEESVGRWERIYDVLDRGEMPPREADQPTSNEKRSAQSELATRLLKHSPVGGTIARRLNREEYENTLRDLFAYPEFSVPESFPSDDTEHGFDNIGEALLISPTLMQQYMDVATALADEVFPPQRGSIPFTSKQHQIAVEHLNQSRETGAHQVGNVFRLVSSRNMASSAAWPTRFEATQSGVYRLRLTANLFQTDQMHYEKRDQPLRLTVYARPNSEQYYAPFGDLRQLATFSIDPNQSESPMLEAEIELYRGEVFGLRWENGPAFSDPPVREYSTRFLAERLTSDRLFYAAMLKMQGGPRGTNQVDYYEAMVKLMKSGALDLTDHQLDKLPEHYGGGIGEAPHNWIKTFVHEEMLRFGPAIDLCEISIEGPLRLVEDDEQRRRRARTKTLLGQSPDALVTAHQLRPILERFLSRVFRRPLNERELTAYQKIASEFLNSNPGSRPLDALHVVVRRALVSGDFLFREVGRGQLDAFALASRLSYFLTSEPPDGELFQAAKTGRLSVPQELRRQVERLIDDPRCQHFVKNFTGQWLATRRLKDIMPDPRLLPFFDSDRDALIQETEMFFAEVLKKNLPIETFIDADFSYRNANLNKVYGGDLKGGQMRRIELGSGERRGGILEMGSVMMATANGVDTQPILRGAWILDNVFGLPTPPPPGNVPAIAPDTSGSTSIREQIAAHRADQQCAVCHRMIDPIGIVMENFDPVGRWRDTYPIYTQDASAKLDDEFYKNLGKGTAKGPPVDASSELPDGTKLHDVEDLKKYLIKNRELFARCLTQKLLTYATGRGLSFGDRQVARQIARELNKSERGFRDLIIAIVESESFRTH